ncbi:type II CRISPR RNA-guided endonuclease Cas9 [Helicobacter sp. 23-1048]
MTKQESNNLKVLGFDIGIASIGWALVEDGGTRDSRKIIDCGVRIFESVGESHKDRGEKRRARRNVARTKSRLNTIKRYLFENFGNTQDFSDFNEWQKALFAKKELPNPYDLRIKALSEQISIDELCQIIIHIIKHRAYNDSGKEYEAENILETQDETIQENSKNEKSNNKDEKKDKNADTKKLKSAMKENAINAKNSPSVVSYLYDKQFEKAMKYAEQKYNALKDETKHLIELRKEQWIEKVAQNSVKMRNKEQDKVKKNGEKVVDKSGKVKTEPTYFNSIPRSAIKAELKKILDTQISKSNNDSFTQKLENLRIVLFAENENGLGFLQNRPLKSSQNLLGKCSIDERECRASAFAPSVIEFNLLSKLANLLTYLNGQYKELDFDYAKTSESAIQALQEKQKLNFSDIRSCIYLKNEQNLAQDYTINLLGFNKKEKKADKAQPTKKAKGSNKINTQEKNTIFYNPSKKLALLEMTFGKEMLWKNQCEIDTLAGILSVNKRKKDILKELDKCSDIDEDLKQKALDSLGAGFSGTSAYCLNVIWECLENMRLGMSEYEATQIYKANLSLDKEYQKYMEQFSKSTKLPAFDETPNASLNRICAQMRQIANAIFAKYGEVAKIRIELLREVGQSEKQKAEMIKNQRENEKFNETAKKICEEIGLKINGDNITKVKLWILQNEYDIYPSIQKGSQDKFNAKEFYADYKDKPSIDVYDFKKITLQDLRDENALQIDHIIPKSKVLVDEFSNKVLTFTGNNATKSSRTPYQWFGDDKAKWEDFKTRIESTQLSKKAKSNLLKQEIDDVKPSRWLSDTKTATTYIRNYLEKYVKFADIPNDLQDSEERESKQIRRIEVVNGRLTSMLRHYWGIGKKDRGNHLHHAQDAVAIAFCSSGIIQNFAKFLQIEEDRFKKKLSSEEINEIIKQNAKGRWVFKRPFSGFATDLAKRIYGDENSEGIFVTFDKKHRTKGKLHNDNPLKIKDNLNKGDKEELAKRLANAQSEFLSRVEREKENLGRMLSGEEYGKIKSKIEHPIIEQFYSEVKERQIKNNVWIEIKGHIYEIEGMTRIDIFYLNDRYYAVPVFITDKELSHIAKPDNCQLDDKDFLFSLHIGDLIEFEYSDGIKRYGYYRGFKQSGDVTIYHHSGYLTPKEKEENFWNDEQVSKDKKTDEKVIKKLFPQKILKIHLFKSIKLCHINALGDRNTLKALDINKGDRVRGKAPLSKTMGARKANK